MKASHRVVEARILDPFFIAVVLQTAHAVAAAAAAKGKKISMRKGVIFFARTMNLLLLLLLGLFLCSLLPMAIPACTRARGSFWGCRQLMGRKHEVNNLDLWLSSSPTFVVRYYCGSSRLRTPPQKLALQFVILLLLSPPLCHLYYKWKYYAADGGKGNHRCAT